MQQRKFLPSQNVIDQWKTGPLKDIELTPGHGRGIFCMSILRNQLVTGSADHGLREYNFYRRELFSKKYGHSEWVTSCQYLKDGRILSAGMDSKLCLWDARAIRADDILGHQGSITKVLVDEHNIGISSSYDTTLRIWDLDTKSDSQKLYGVHKEAVLDFQWHNSLLVSGDKNGVIAIWDINEAKPIKIEKVHKGGVSQILLYSDGMDNNLIVTTGINDGMVCIQDMRTNKLVHSQQIHGGSINSVISNLSSFRSIDKTIKMIDIIGGFKVRTVMKTIEGVYSMQTIYNLTIAGCADGNICVYDNDTGKCLYGFGVMSKGIVRDIKITEDQKQLVAIGDDFSPIILKYAE